MNSQHRLETIAYVCIVQQSWTHGQIEGEVRASQYKWRFKWHFKRGRLWVHPALGRALIYEPLERFLEHCDYQLEPGGNYQFTMRAEL
ncbi:DUF3146 family protein [Cyanobacterium sp. uoEpiScrs1]|uniref:DUF3146 family protein n=1 Tax=Cyanobacterium sp. uoEpiScrs1 TaxID=2976343 RepID=UPI00226A143E|nr:DUF3146 family protein [Cyanobacterium sp. uoEpiScrs1]